MALVDETLWKRLSPVLDRALELDGDARAALVDSLRASDPALAEALERMLGEHDRALDSGFLANAPAAATVSLEGQQLGPYTLVERIGTGGMGSVWRARRSDGRFEGDVAVKLLHPSLFEGEGAERFRREGSILSRLTHPGIARLYDAGLSNAGQPYLVLELVDGERIDRHADARRLPVRDRIELFLQVCEAVAHAHASLVVHRDLKPSNILVDRAGRVKLLDFGIATLLDAASGEARGRTVTAARALTPEYAAPEQLEGAPVTTATDVYALGVLLYELLTGEHPTLTADTSPADLVRAVTAVDPPKMSDRVRRRSTRSDPAPALRATTEDRLASSLAGDLDLVVAKALKKSPTERYPTVSAFADDVRRWLELKPISARPDSLAYRFRRLVRRRKLETVAVALAILSLVASTAIAWRQARASAAERDRALEELVRAEFANGVSSLLLSEADLVGGRAAKRGLLLAGEKMTEEAAAQHPSRAAHQLFVLAKHYYLLSELGEWRKVLERARELASRESDRPLRAMISCELAAAMLEFDPEKAPALLEEGWSHLAGIDAPAAALSQCWYSEAIVARRRGDLDSAYAAATAAVAHERSRPGPVGREIDELNTLAFVLSELGRYAEVERTYEELLALDEAAAVGRRRIEIHLHNRAVNLHGAGLFRKAAEVSGRAVALARERDPRGGPLTMELYFLASSLSLVGRHDEAIAAAAEAVERARAEEGPHSLFWSLVYAGRVEAEAGRHSESAERFAEADRLVAAHPELPAPMLVTGNRFRASALVERGPGPDTVAAATRALVELETSGRPPREILQALLVVARAQNDDGASAAAAASATRALQLARERLGGLPHSRHVGAAELETARAAWAVGDARTARAAVARALENLRASLGDDAPETRRARSLAELVG